MSSASVRPPDRSTTAGTDFLQLDPADAAPGGLSEWLAGALRLAIADGRLALGSVLPPTRVLAADLKVSRGVVTEAYQRLSGDGHVAGRGRAGTVVVAAPATTPAGAGTPVAADVFGTPPGAAVFDTLRAAPAAYDLSPGAPDLASFPRTAWLRAERSVLETMTPAEFGYGDPRGTPALRVAVARWLARNRGIPVDPADIVVVAGVSQALALISAVLQQDGVGTLAVEDPGSLGARQHLQHWGMLTPPVTVDGSGLDVAELSAAGHPAVMVTPAHQFPYGVVLEGGRRRELLRWAALGGVVLEDDYDAEHRYDRAPVAALRAMSDQVYYTGSISKLLAPALRIGWVIAPPRRAADLVDAKRYADLGNPAVAQLVLARLMESGELERHLRRLRRRHVRRRDAMLDAIARHLPGAQVHGAAAGLHLTATFGGDFDDTALAGAALALGVKVQPLSWHAQRPHRPGLVMGYAASSPGHLTEAVAAVGRALAICSPNA